MAPSGPVASAVTLAGHVTGTFAPEVGLPAASVQVWVPGSKSPAATNTRTRLHIASCDLIEVSPNRECPHKQDRSPQAQREHSSTSLSVGQVHGQCAEESSVRSS